MVIKIDALLKAAHLQVQQAFAMRPAGHCSGLVVQQQRNTLRHYGFTSFPTPQLNISCSSHKVMLILIVAPCQKWQLIDRLLSPDQIPIDHSRT
jgi:hypothetical protein